MEGTADSIASGYQPLQKFYGAAIDSGTKTVLYCEGAVLANQLQSARREFRSRQAIFARLAPGGLVITSQREPAATPSL